MKGKYLITTNDWFYAPDGNSYKAVWGDVEILDDDKVLGIKTNRQSTNWFAKIGSSEKHVIIAGCQIYYAVRCQAKPSNESPIVENIHEGKVILGTTMNRIYIAE